MNYNVYTHKFIHTKTGLTSLVNHYTPLRVRQVGSRNLVTLIFAHGSSNHKEQWEPVIDYLFSKDQVNIEGAWSLDWQNHGQSALLNKDALKHRDAVGIEEYGDLLREFIQSPCLVDKYVIAVGHSGSTAAWTIAAFEATLATSPIKMFIFFEPVHIHPPIYPNDVRLEKGVTNVKGVKMRKTTFANKEEATNAIRKRIPWRLWDKRVQDAYLNYGFTTNAETGQFTTCCTTIQEAWSYEPYVYLLCGNLYPKLCASFETHLVFGERPEMYSEEIRRSFSDKLEGRSPASSQVLPKTGHLLVQEKPDECGKIIHGIIATRGEKLAAMRSHL